MNLKIGIFRTKLPSSQIYDEARKFIEFIPKSEIASTAQDVFQKKNEIASPFIKELNAIIEYAKNNDIPEVVNNAINKLYKNANTVLMRLDSYSQQGRTVAHAESIFKKANKNEIHTISNYFDNKVREITKNFFNNGAEIDFDEYNKLFGFKFLLKYKPLQSSKITECPKRLLPQKGIYYHGTTKPNKVLEEGFSPYISNQLGHSPRELGCGIYLTPDINVAAYFAGLKGKVLAVEVDPKNVAIVTDKSFSTLSRAVINLLKKAGIESKNSFSNAVYELLMREVLKAGAFDAVYAPKGFAFGRSISLDSILGKAESQFILLHPEHVKSVFLDEHHFTAKTNRTLKLKTFMNTVRNFIRTIKKDPEGLFLFLKERRNINNTHQIL